MNVLASSNYVYAVNENDATLSAFQVGTSGALTLIATYPVGVAPNAIASDPTSKFLYITDGAANQLIGFLIQVNGTLINMQTPFKTDILPDSVQVDPRGIYVYVANYNANDVSAYTIDRSTGNATQIAGSTTYASGRRAHLRSDRTRRSALCLHVELPRRHGVRLGSEPCDRGAVGRAEHTLQGHRAAYLRRCHYPRQPCHRGRTALILHSIVITLFRPEVAVFPEARR